MNDNNALHRATHSTARGEQRADSRATSHPPQHTALQIEWDTAQLDDWGIDMPDFTDEEGEDAIASEDDYEMPEEIEEVETDIKQGDLIILEGRGLTHRLKEHIDTVLCREKRISTWIFRNIQVENFYFPRGEEKILRRNQMKLRRK